MIAKLKGLDSADTPDGSLASFRPEDPEEFRLGVTASIGPADGDGAELFQFEVCSPTAMRSETGEKGYAFVRHVLLVERWDAELVESAIRDLCQRVSGDTWSQVAERLARHGYWEFEDYQAR